MFINILWYLLKMGFWCFISVLGTDLICRKTYIKNFAYITHCTEEEEESLCESFPAHGILQTFIICCIPLLNLVFILYYIYVGFFIFDNTIEELRSEWDRYNND